MSTDVPEGQPTRKLAAITRELHIIDGVRIVRTTKLFVDADTGEPLGVHASDIRLPPMIVWAAEAGIDQ